MFSSIIQNIAKPFNRSHSNQSTGSATGPATGRDDRVEDGFLLVGDTASERTIINARNFRADTIDAPPNYKEASNNCLPSYQDYTASMHSQSPTLDVSQFPDIQHGNPFQTGSTTVNTGREAHGLQQRNPTDQGFADMKSARTAISDVPFVLGNGLQSPRVVQEMRSSNIFQQKTFDYSLYDYNFNLERSFLNEQEGYRENESMEFSY
ncbi:uncharacterized protein LOC123531776 [Mercenaria mercenaria]|uniref:uncharacterized protein LOC123531776 n=1 Tax=Mercenaria mercenaria TaxID=6596 RepID=UPI00234EE4F2|nr:uncharacterized protein LOC123531776 [Mercenaria mercenaria]